MHKQITYKIKGMNRDLSVSTTNPEYAYEIKNMRIMSTTDNTLLSLVNEKGTKQLDIVGVTDSVLEGIPIGQVVLDNELVVFTTNDAGTDRIYKFWFDGDTFKGELLFSGDLDFSTAHPIEGIGLYENTELRKVYWTDGINQPRFINIGASSEVKATWNNTSFDFIRDLKLKETVTINKIEVSNGQFAPGVLQYCFSYYNKYGQESNIFYTSPQYYTAHDNRGGSPEDKVNDSFKITINGADLDFDYIRVYSILRTSIDAAPLTKRVIDLKVSEDSVTHVAKSIIYVDNGISGDAIEPSKLFYIGGEKAIYQTLSHKDGTLFLGNITVSRKFISQTIKDFFKDKEITFSNSDSSKTLPALMPSGYYTYENQLKNNSNSIKTFKHLEYYRFGVQFQHKSGRWSEPVFICDKQNDKKIVTSFPKADGTAATATFLPVASYVFNNTTYINELVNTQGFIKVRPVIVYPELNDREVICQGVLCPTVYNVQDRYSNSPFAQSSWFTRPNLAIDEASNIRVDALPEYYYMFYLKDSAYTFSDVGTDRYTLVLESGGSVISTRDTYVIIKSLDNPIRNNAGKVIICQTLVNKTVLSNPVPPQNSGVPEYMDAEAYVLKRSAGAGTLKLYYYKVEYTLLKNWLDLEDNTTISLDSRAGMWDSETEVYIEPTTKATTRVEAINNGSIAEFRHNKPIPANIKRNAEIQCIKNPPSDPYLTGDQIGNAGEYISQNMENFYIDQSIFTMHSPEIEFDDTLKSIDGTALKLRIVGIVPMTASVGDIDIQTSTPKVTSSTPGFYMEKTGVENLGINAARNLISGIYWVDGQVTYDPETSLFKGSGKSTRGYAVYPWHRNGSLNNAAGKANASRPAMLNKKKISNLKYSYNSVYYDNADIWNAFVNQSTTQTGISGVTLFDSNEQVLTKIPSPLNSDLNDISYYGNIDRIINGASSIEFEKGYPIVRAATDEKDDEGMVFTLYREKYSTRRTSDADGSVIKIDTDGGSTDPIHIKYKSSPHIVMALNYTNVGDQRVLPTTVDNYWNGTSFTSGVANSATASSKQPFWAKEVLNISQDVLATPNVSEYTYSENITYSFLWLAELYKDAASISNRFGGTSDEAFENNQWVPCGEIVSLIDSNNAPLTTATIKWTEGDTYFQRYDHLKTYPYTQEDQNSVIEIISFMCETRINLDGRYDRNRGQVSNLAVTPQNFNLMNPVYSQANNFFTYRAINPNKLNLDYFPNTITWSLTKALGELVDSWTNITLATSLDLDGDKGVLKAIRRFNNELYAFQDKGIAGILYNSRTMISATDGVPIELANSGKVEGKRYLSNDIGCSNKWSIGESSNGLYFIDNIGQAIYLFNGQLQELSNKFGFHSWVANNNSSSTWTPSTFANTVTYYDKINKEILFISDDNTLVFSEPLSTFSSFYSYESAPYFVNLSNRSLWINKSRVTTNTKYKMWAHHEGDYNYYFDQFAPYYATIIVNPEPLTDKIFNTLEFRADTFHDDLYMPFSTFDKLYTWNEYQSGELVLGNLKNHSSPLKKKFKIWRVNIPRDKVYKRDRMRNPWLYLKLAKEDEDGYKTILHDLTISYFGQ